MENFGLFELFNKILSQKQLFQPNNEGNSPATKTENITKQQTLINKTTQLPSYYTQLSIISLIKRHDELSKKIDKDNKKS